MTTFFSTSAQHAKDAEEVLRSLSIHVQVLGCIQWLGKFQVLPCISLTESVACDAVAEVVGVPVSQLCRIIRMTSTVGILCEPQIGYVAHSPLSARLVERPSLVDAMIFIAETMLPAALGMENITHGFREGLNIKRHATAHGQQPSLAARSPLGLKSTRGHSAYRRTRIKEDANAITRLLLTLYWQKIVGRTVVEINARSTSTAVELSKHHSNLRVIVQMNKETKQRSMSTSAYPKDAANGVNVQYRGWGEGQTETDASVYLLHLPDPSMFASSSEHKDACLGELQTHFKLLRSHNVNLILIAPILVATENHTIEAERTACLQDLLLLQSGHEESFDIQWLKRMLEQVQEDATKLTIACHVSSEEYPMTVFKLEDTPSTFLAGKRPRIFPCE